MMTAFRELHKTELVQVEGRGVAVVVRTCGSASARPSLSQEGSHQPIGMMCAKHSDFGSDAGIRRRRPANFERLDVRSTPRFRNGFASAEFWVRWANLEEGEGMT